jgi:hypothetical protein
MSFTLTPARDDGTDALAAVPLAAAPFATAGRATWRSVTSACVR